MQSTTTPRRSPRLAAKAAAHMPRRSARIAAAAEARAEAEHNDAVQSALTSYYKIKAACDAAGAAIATANVEAAATALLSLEPSRMSAAAAAARAAADAVLEEEKQERMKARQELADAWDTYLTARHYAMLSAMRERPEDEQETLVFLATVAYDNLTKYLKYADALGVTCYDDEE